MPATSFLSARQTACSPAMDFREPGCLTADQARALMQAAERGLSDPLYLSDQEGAGPIAELERRFAGLCNAPNAMAVSSCTAAIHASLLALEVEPEVEIITTPYTWASTVAPIYQLGATPVFADIDPKTAMLDPAEVEKRITERTKGILTVHIFGQEAGTEAICDIAHKHGLWVVGDAAQLAPNCQAAAKLAQLEDVMCFSLGRGKPVCGGEGGIMVTRHEELLSKAVAWAQHPDRARRQFGPNHPIAPWALNFRIHPLAAVLALADMQGLESKMRHRVEAYEAFWQGIECDLPVKCSPQLFCMDIVPYGIPATLDQRRGITRESLISMAQERNIPLRPGPVRKLLHVLENQSDLGKLKFAEQRIGQDLWVVSPIDMDCLAPEESYHLGELISNLWCSIFVRLR